MQAAAPLDQPGTVSEATVLAIRADLGDETASGIIGNQSRTSRLRPATPDNSYNSLKCWKMLSVSSPLEKGGPGGCVWLPRSSLIPETQRFHHRTASRNISQTELLVSSSRACYFGASWENM